MSLPAGVPDSPMLNVLIMGEPETGPFIVGLLANTLYLQMEVVSVAFPLS